MREGMKSVSLSSVWKSLTTQPALIGAVLLRLALMPFFAHEDLFSTYRRALEIALGERSLLSLTSFIPHLIEVTALKMYSLFTGLEYFTTIFRPLTDIPNINAVTFFFKVPYLLAEMVFWWLFLRAFSPNKTLRGWILFNPIVLYSVYIFGRFESFVLVLLTLVMIWLSRQELVKMGIGFLLALATRVSLVLLAPAFLLLRLPGKTKLLTIGSMVLGTVISLLLLPAETSAGLFNWLLNGQHTGYLLEAKLNLGWNFTLYLLPLSLVFSLLILSGKLRTKAALSLTNLDIFSISSTVILFLYYALAIAHPQYYVWVLPMWWYLLGRFRSASFGILNGLFTLSYFFTLPAWEGKTTVGTLFPIADFFWLIQLTGEPWTLIAGLAKSVLAGALLYGVYELLRLPERKSGV